MSVRILVVDDDKAVRSAVRLHLERRRDEVVLVENAQAAFDQLRKRPFDVVLTDVKMPGISGLDLLAKVRTSWPETPVVVMTGNASVTDAVTAMKGGAADYLVKPVERDELYVVLDRAVENRNVRAELVQLRQQVRDRSSLSGMIGTAPAMQALFAEITAVADSSATVLIQGPTGAGKELVAHALHHRSRRGRGPFVRVNCAAIPSSLVESELFGHEQGAFTGAVRQHVGRFEQADGGTLFLDEIGEIDPAVQSKLLRVLEAGEFQRVGGTQTQHVDVRVLAATNRDLKHDVASDLFRADLYYRLAVVTLAVPALAERIDDVPALVEHFVKLTCEREEREVPAVSPSTLARLATYTWPGNVRELQHAVERAVILHRDAPTLEIPLPGVPALGPLAVPLAVPSEPGQPLHEVLDATERALLLQALEDCDGVQARAAERLGLSKSNLGYRMKRLGIVRRGTRYA